ncbi:MAG: Fic family protein [Bacillota bacterium]|nr:Fic family protein [Bacillota bacterium]
MQQKSIWNPIEFDPKWNEVKTDKFDNIYPSWEKRRKELIKHPDQYRSFIDQLKRKQAIDTGIIERMYDLKKGITETFVREGFVDSYLQHGDTDIAPSLLMDYLRDNFSAIDFIFDFVKSRRKLSVGCIKELHSLITQHQFSVDAIDQFGNHIQVPLLKGQYKQHPNNPMREGIVYNYCPPEQVDAQMDSLILLFNENLKKAHVLIKAAFLHHAFVMIHPFQDGNGRIARLLASFVLIKEGLFPLSIDRDERTKYIDALESADNHVYQPIVDVLMHNQIASIERSLNWKTVEETTGYTGVVDLLSKKISEYRVVTTEQQSKRILSNMQKIFTIISHQMEQYKTELTQKLKAKIDITYCEPGDSQSHYYARQIIEYANQFDYYVNLSLNKCWVRMFIEIDDKIKYRLVLSLHHYGYDSNTYAIGAFLSKVIQEAADNQIADEIRRSYMDVPLGIPPLTMSTEKRVSELTSSISQQIEISVMAALAYIANEL